MIKSCRAGKASREQTPSSLPCAQAMLFKGRACGLRPRSKRPRFRNILGIATAIRLPVDSLWPGWIRGRLQSCSDVGRFRWSCATHISLRNTRHRLWIGWFLPRDEW